MRTEAEFQRLKSQAEARERDLENLDAEPGDPVIYEGRTWLFLEVEQHNNGPTLALENWNEGRTGVSPGAVEPKE